MIRRLAILLLVCGGLGFFLQREQARGTFDEWERHALARLQRVQGPLAPPPPVVLVELRRGDLPFESWPPAPLDYALVFESLVRRQPREVVVQPLLAWPGVESLDAATLVERIALLPRGVLSCTLQRGVDGLVNAPGTELPLAVLAEASGDRSKVPAFAHLGQVPIDDLRAGKALGFTRIEFGESIAAHGDTITVPLLARRGNDLVPSLVLQALLGWLQTAPTDVGVQLGRRLAIGSSLEVPVDAGGRLALSPRLAPPLRRIDAGALLLDLDRDAKLMTERPTELETLRSMEGALVVLGETGENTPRFPVAGTPDGGWTEAEVIARSLVAALSGFHLREPPTHWQWAGWAAVVALGASLLACPRRWLPFFALGGAAALLLGLALAFMKGQWWVAPVPPLSLWLAAFAVALLLPPPSRSPARPAAAPVAPAAPGAPAASTASAASEAPVAPVAPSAPTAPDSATPADPVALLAPVVSVAPMDFAAAGEPDPDGPGLLVTAPTAEVALVAVAEVAAAPDAPDAAPVAAPAVTVDAELGAEMDALTSQLAADAPPEEKSTEEEEATGASDPAPDSVSGRPTGTKTTKWGRKGPRSARGRGPGGGGGGAPSGE